MLGDELGTASNIKSRVNRQSVLGAITSAQQRLKLYNKVCLASERIGLEHSSPPPRSQKENMTTVHLRWPCKVSAKPETQICMSWKGILSFTYQRCKTSWLVRGDVYNCGGIILACGFDAFQAIRISASAYCEIRWMHMARSTKRLRFNNYDCGWHAGATKWACNLHWNCRHGWWQGKEAEHRLWAF